MVALLQRRVCARLGAIARAIETTDDDRPHHATVPELWRALSLSWSLGVKRGEGAAPRRRRGPCPRAGFAGFLRAKAHDWGQREEWSRSGHARLWERSGRYELGPCCCRHRRRPSVVPPAHVCQPPLPICPTVDIAVHQVRRPRHGVNYTTNTDQYRNQVDKSAPISTKGRGGHAGRMRAEILAGNGTAARPRAPDTSHA